MSTFHSPQSKPLYRTDIFSPPKTKQLYQINEPLENLRQKALSFNYEPKNTYPKAIVSNPFYTHGSFQQKQPQFHQKLRTLENESNKNTNFYICSPQKKSSTINRYFPDSQQSKVAQFNFTTNEKKSGPENNIDKEYFRNKILRFESLRSTLTVNQNSSQNFHTIPISMENNQKRKMIACNNVVGNNFYAKKQNNSLSPSFVGKIVPSSVNSSFETKSKLKQQRNHNLSEFISHKKLSNLKELKQNTPSFYPLKNQDSKTQRERKFPSFLISRVQRKQNEKEEKNQFRPFERLTPINSKHQNQDEVVKIPHMKKFLNTKHVKSYSVFENLCCGNKRNSLETKQPKNLGHFKKEMTDFGLENRQKSNSIQVNQAEQKQAIKIDTKNVRKSNEIKKMPKQLLAFRQSLDRFALNTKLVGNSSFKRQDNSKIITNQNKKVKFDDKYSKESQKIIFEKVQNERHDKGQNLQNKKCSQTNNLQTIDDIKQTLINCNLFSEEDYKGVFQNHKKDILKQNRHNYVAQTFHLKSQTSRLKSSIKDLIDSSSSQDSQSNRCTVEQRKLAELASMCQQKRSKWILDQTDTIRQSLKELSEFNTEKSLYQNEWKKISMKDFITTRKNLCSVQYENIDEIREEQSLLESRDFKLSSVKILYDSSVVKEGYRFTEQGVFKKKESYQRQFHFQLNKGQFSDVSLEDFTYRWSSEEPIVHGNSQNEFTFVIYTAQHRLTKTLYLIKKYEKSIFHNLGQTFMSNFIKSVKIQMKLLNHPNIQKIYTVFSDKHNIYLLCEYTSTKLSKILTQKDQNLLVNSSQQSICLNTLSSEYQKVQMFRQAIDSLEEIHLNHIMHKNFQPNSIRIIWDSFKISGFEICEVSDKLSDPEVSNSYVCPQNLFDSSKTAMDIWCLGILAYEILIGKKPFQSDNDKSNSTVKKILQCNFDIPTEKSYLCEEILNMALKRNPKDRASIFDIKNVWAKKMKKFSTILTEHQQIHKNLQSILQY